MRRDGDALHLHRTARFGRPRIHRGLQVHVFEDRQLPRYHRQRLTVGAEEVLNDRHHLVAVLIVQSVRVHPVQERPERCRELPRFLLRKTGHDINPMNRLHQQT